MDQFLTPYAAGIRGSIRRLAPDSGGWAVFEHAEQPGPTAKVALVFATEFVVRRVPSYPADWRELSERDLLALLWKNT